MGACVKCKKEIPDGAVFCPWCGKKQIHTKNTSRKRGNGQGSAYKRGRTWTAIWTTETYSDGEAIVQKRKTKGGFPSKNAALTWVAGMRTEEKKCPALRDYWIGWEKTDYPILSKSKQDAYRIAWGRFAPLAGKQMDELTIEVIQACVDQKTSTYYPAHDMKILLSHLFDRAVAEGNARANLAKYIRLPKVEETEPKPFTEEELKRIWDSYGAGDRFCGYILLMVYSGMMPGELLSLEPEMIQWDTHEIHGAGKKTKKRKTTPIVFPDMIGPVLADLVENRPRKASKYVVGMNKDNFYKNYYAALEKAGTRPLPPYSCRHTTATALALGNIAPSVIQEVMRHTKFTTTQRYIHPDRASSHAAVNSMAGFPAPAKKTP